MIKKEYKTVTHEVTENIVVAEHLICDNCNHEIEGHYWHLTTMHSDWGNDSVDSIELFHIYSPKCLREKFEEYLNESNNGYNTQEFNVTHYNHRR